MLIILLRLILALTLIVPIPITTKTPQHQLFTLITITHAYLYILGPSAVLPRSLAASLGGAAIRAPAQPRLAVGEAADQSDGSCILYVIVYILV